MLVASLVLVWLASCLVRSFSYCPAVAFFLCAVLSLAINLYTRTYYFIYFIYLFIRILSWISSIAWSLILWILYWICCSTGGKKSTISVVVLSFHRKKWAGPFFSSLKGQLITHFFRSFPTAHAPIASGKKVSPYSSYYGYIPTFLLVTTIRTPLTVTDTRTLSATGW